MKWPVSTPWMLLTTTVGSIALGACGTVHVATDRVQTSLYAPAEPATRPGTPPTLPERLASPASIARLELDDLLAYAQEHGPAIRVASAQCDVAAAAGVESRELLHDNPELRFVARDLALGEGAAFGFEVGFLQRLEIAGQHALRLRTADARRLVFESLLGEARWAVRVEVQRLFARVLLVRERVRHAQRFVDFAEAMRRIAVRQVELGESSPLVGLVANVEVAQAQAMLVEARQEKRSLRHQLALVVGWPSPELPEIVGDLPAVHPALSARQLLSLMAEHHPALRTRELAVLAGRAHLRSANREAAPSPTVGVAFESEASPAEEGRHQSWTVRMTIPLPIWSQNQVARARAEAELVLADREREETVTRLRVEVREAASALDAAAEQVTLYENAVVPQLEENLVRLERAYELGEVDAQEVFLTRARLLEGISGFIDARVAYFNAAASLRQVVGTELLSTHGLPGRLNHESGEER